MRAWLARNCLPLAAFGVALVVLSATAGPRLADASRDPHFALQATAWLQGRLDVPVWPPGVDDPAVVETVALDDGAVVRGRWVGKESRAFRSLAGEEIPSRRVQGSTALSHYVAFPPFPALLMLPQAALSGAAASDVATTLLLGALAPALLLVLLRRLREEGLSERRPVDDLWLAGLLTFGTVFYFSAVQGRVWYTAHVVAVDLCILYLWASLGAARPLLAGSFLGLAFATRTPLLFAFPFFVWEAFRLGRREGVRRSLAFAAPILLIGLVLALHNVARFGDPFEFGHRYLAVVQQADIERHGLFSLRYLARNATAAFALLPRLQTEPPFVSISGHGLAIWFTTPALLFLLRRPREERLHRPLWVTVACVAPWTLLYQNTGWFQFGYRFALDYMVFLLVLLALGRQRFDRGFRAVVVFGVVVNLFGAVTFGRMHGFYRPERARFSLDRSAGAPAPATSYQPAAGG